MSASKALPRLWAVVPAAGSGRRFGGDTPKQYLTIEGEPIMTLTLNRLFHLPLAGCVVAIAPEDTQAATLRYDHPDRIHFVTGGGERMDSVLAGLWYLKDHAQDDDWVLVHDVARPCIAPESLDDLVAALQHDPVGGILAIPVRDTLKRAKTSAQGLPEISETVSREQLWMAQTPQMFRYALLRDALQYAQTHKLHVTDEASAIELAGLTPKLVEGRPDNLKITYAADLPLARLILTGQSR